MHQQLQPLGVVAGRAHLAERGLAGAGHLQARLKGGDDVVAPLAVALDALAGQLRLVRVRVG